MKSFSTSRFNLNADFGLSVFEKAKWLMFNYLNNFKGDRLLDHRIKISKFQATQMINWNEVDLMASPARRLCEFYWMSLNWDLILSFLKTPIRAVEIGSGTGKYGTLLNKLVSNNLEFYRGIDLIESSEMVELLKDPKFQFRLGNADTIADDLVGSNFIFTQSALEHFEKDLTFFTDVANYVENSNHPIIQIHLVPSRACLTTFPWHGFRQYTNSSISKVTQLFSNRSKFEWVSLGGEACNKVHKKFITNFLKGDLRKIMNMQYNKELKEAILLDNDCKNENFSSFQVLVIWSNFDC